MTASALPVGWASTQLGNVLLAIVGGGTPSRTVPAYFDGPVPWFTVKDLKALRPSDAAEHISHAAIAESATSLLPPNTLITATRIALGRAIRPTVACAINQDLKALMPRPGISPEFLLYWIVANQRAIQDLGSGTTVSGIRLETLRALELWLPPTVEQEHIVAKLEELLSDLDAGVAELKAAQKKLTKYRQSLLKAAVEGELTADWRAQRAQQGEAFETGAQLLERILRERRARWEAKQLAKFEEQGKAPPKGWQGKYPEPVPPDTTGLPELPQGWVWASLNQLVCDLRSGSAETSGRDQTDYPVLKSSAVRQAAIDFEALNYLQQDQCRSENYLEIGDFLVTRLSGSVDYVGCSAIVTSVPVGGVQYPDRIFCAKTLSSMPWLGDFLVCCFRSGYARSRIEVAAKSTAGHKRISMSDLHPFPIPLPPMDEAQAILQQATDSLKQAEEGEIAVVRALKQATAQRQNLLKSAFSGQLVAQDPADEPASKLLERIRAERTAKSAQLPTKTPRRRKAAVETDSHDDA